MKIEDGIYILEMDVKVAEIDEKIYPVVLGEKDNLILVDTAFPGQYEKLKEEVKSEGLDFQNIKGVIFTHHDIDHIGNVHAILKENPQVNVLAYIDEKDYLNGKKKPLKLEGIEINMAYVPEKIKNIYIQMKSAFKERRVEPDLLLEDGEVIDCLEGIHVIHTPGHTKGHMSLYIEKYKTLIAGDSLSVKEGCLIIGDDNMHYDAMENKKSIKKFLNYDIDKVICYHGGLFEGNVKESIEKLLS